MSGRSLSNGTLSMRFMQNAARAKQLAQAELEQAKVKDEAEWEVPTAVRESWGIKGSTREVEHEKSYVPFMSDVGEGSSASTVYKGRRKFDTKGQEVLAADIPKEDLVEAPGEQKDWSKGNKRPVTISGSSVMVNSRKDKDDGKKTNHVRIIDPREARSKMFDTANVGEDLRPKRSTHGDILNPSAKPIEYMVPPKPAGVEALPAESLTGFLKPTGVDTPRQTNTKRFRDTVDGKEKKKKKKQRTADS